MAEKFASHLLVGLFLGAFGLAFLALTLWRLVRLVDLLAVNEEETDEELVGMGRNNIPPPRERVTATAKEHEAFRGGDVVTATEGLLREFLYRHVPEQNTSFLRAASVAIAALCTFGIVYTMLGGRFFNHDLHPEYTLFHYVTHLTLLLLYLFVGWTGLLEANGYLPRDSLRAATAVALWGEALLWTQHGASKTNDLDASLHYAIGGIAGVTAACMTASVALVAWTTNGVLQHYSNPTLSFGLYVGALVGLVWQALWFATVAFYIQGWLPIPSTSHATALLVVEGLVLLVGCQLATVGLVRRTRHRSRGIPPLSSAGVDGKLYHETSLLVAQTGNEEIELFQNEESNEPPDSRE